MNQAEWIAFGRPWFVALDEARQEGFDAGRAYERARQRPVAPKTAKASEAIAAGYGRSIPYAQLKQLVAQEPQQE